ncbi:hypothetical protein HY933_03515 [Candidatus Falkowbacteria bacterium]|nr:hypothetical protein [Candidatus Falkowbacteria bacterium]
MSPERWQTIKGQVKDNPALKVLEEDAGEFDDMPGSFESLVFMGPMGKIKLEFITRPVVLDKKTNTSRRIGAEASVEYIYSEDEFSHKLTVYQWNEATDDWDELKSSMFGGE